MQSIQTYNYPSTNKDGVMPVMNVHLITCLKDFATFKKDSNYQVFIAKFDNNRFAVMSADFFNYTEHYKVFDSEDELHETFHEAV